MSWILNTIPVQNETSMKTLELQDKYIKTLDGGLLQNLT